MGDWPARKESLVKLKDLHPLVGSTLVGLAFHSAGADIGTSAMGAFGVGMIVWGSR